ncbi:MAG: FadR/GntR family transcriptional regulator [Chitinophagaceae bacterium]
MSTHIQRKCLAEEVAQSLQQQISSEVYKPGAQLPTEPELMKNFGVGRSSIREAIKILSQGGFITVHQGVGTFVNEREAHKEPLNERLKRASLLDLEEVRQLLEMKIAEKAALNRTIGDIELLKSYLAERKNAAESDLLEECIVADINFHNAIAEASKNEILADIYKAASVHLQKWFIQMNTDTKEFLQKHALHEQLLHDIIEQNPKNAWNTAAKILGHFAK